MAIPSTVTKRAENNDFVGVTGMLLSGVTGFSLRTGFYLTNSGNYSIETQIVSNTDIYPESYTFPSGKKFEILPGENKFIPFDFTFVANEWGVGSGPVSGPYRDGTFVNTLRLKSKSVFNGNEDTSGNIRVYVTGQTTGFGVPPYNTSGPLTANAPLYPSGFRVLSDYALNGRPNATLRWYHPHTGYYLTQYQIERAVDITDSSVSTGDWSTLATFEVNYEDVTVPVSSSTPPTFSFRKYATNTGISQLYSRGTANNRPSNYGEYIDEGLAASEDYYYRIKSQFINDHHQIESAYVYGYPVSNFESPINNTDVNNGLLSGSTTLPVGGDPSTVIKNSAGGPTVMYINIGNNESDYVDLHATFVAESGIRGLEVGAFNSADASTYVFTGIHFVVNENEKVGSKTTAHPAIKTGEIIKREGNVEVPTLLDLKQNSRVVGMGGRGGDGGFTLTESANRDPNILNTGNGRISQINIVEQVSSSNGKNGSAAIYINDTNISKFRIRKDATAKIYGGGGGGGGGDPYFAPKSFLLLEAWRTPNLKKDFSTTAGSKLSLTNNNTVNIDYYTTETIRIGRNASVRRTNIQSVDYKFSDLIGRLSAGVGGGGRGNAKSSAGKFAPSPQENSNYDYVIKEENSGGINKFGLGSTASTSGKISTGGNGGDFGEDGETPIDIGTEYLYYGGTNQGNIGAGGVGGYSIQIVDGNSNYTDLNNLVYYGAGKNPKDIDSIIAYFTINASKMYKNSTYDLNVSANGDQVYKWVSENDNNIYMKNVDNYNRPLYYVDSSDATANDKMYYFNDNPVVFWDGYYNRVLQIEGIIGANKLRPSMEGFEIVYFFSPFNKSNSNWSPFFPETDAQLGAFRTGASSNTASGKKGWGLHHWSDIGGNPDNTNFSFENPSMIYTSDGKTIENAGLQRGNSIVFQDFTNKQSVGRAWMYSISASKIGNSIFYNIYNDLNLVKSTAFFNHEFNFCPNPFIGLTPAGRATAQLRFYGSISDIAIFKKALLPSERRAIFNHFAKTKLRVGQGSVTPITSANALYTKSASRNIRISANLNTLTTDDIVDIGRVFKFDDPEGQGNDIFFIADYTYPNGNRNEFRGRLTRDLPPNTNGVLYPSQTQRNTLDNKAGFAGFNIFPYSAP